MKKGTYRVTELSALKYTLTDVADGGGSCRGTQGEESIIFEIGKTLENRIGKATFTNIRSGNDKPTDKDVVVNRFVYDEKTGEYVIKQIIVPGAGQEEQNAWPNSRSN